MAAVLKNISSQIFLFANNYSNDDFGGVRGNVLKEIWPGSGIKTGDFVNEKVGGLP